MINGLKSPLKFTKKGFVSGNFSSRSAITCSISALVCSWIIDRTNEGVFINLFTSLLLSFGVPSR